MKLIKKLLIFTNFQPQLQQTVCMLLGHIVLTKEAPETRMNGLYQEEEQRNAEAMIH